MTVSKLDPKASKALSADLERMSLLEDAAKVYGQIEKRVKEKMKEQGDGEYSIGKFRVTVEIKSRTTYEIPADVKEKYRAEGSSTSVSWRKV